MSKLVARTLIAATLATGAFAAQAAESPWLMRVRAVNLDSANKDDTGLGLTINNKVIPEVDFSYFISPNLAAELILTYPQKHTLSSSAAGGEIGTLKHLPPTLSLQYHFAPNDAFRPYVGAGLNYTIFSNVEFAPAVDTALSPSVKHTSVGLSFQVGFDYEISKNLYLNVDVKKVQIGTKVYSKGTEVGKFKVDPLLVGVGLGFRF
ncbi:MAG TPA: OmpW family outer membrane protein [Burkholderiaceae bacterium]|nr:OmpW family outer membrane protein [Burkholderiaceae bacterium]